MKEKIKEIRKMIWINREFKFRAWDETNKKMWYSHEMGVSIKDKYNTEWTFTFYFDEDGKLHVIIYTLLDYGFTRKDTKKVVLPLMQFTGLYDKNGKEIYEGDIVRLKEGWIGIIKFYRGCFMIDLLNQDTKNNRSICLRDWDWDNFFIEVIGNVFENL